MLKTIHFFNIYLFSYSIYSYSFIYSIYINILLLFLFRDSIADYLSKSYLMLSYDMAKKYFVLKGDNSDNELKEIVDKYKWILKPKNRRIHFTTHEEKKENEENEKGEEDKQTFSASSSSSSDDETSFKQQQFPSRKFIAHTLKRIAEFERVF